LNLHILKIYMDLFQGHFDHLVATFSDLFKIICLFLLTKLLYSNNIAISMSN
jgi:hypothetical protein